LHLVKHIKVYGPETDNVASHAGKLPVILAGVKGREEAEVRGLGGDFVWYLSDTPGLFRDDY
jgi:hypothetical protein